MRGTNVLQQTTRISTNFWEQYFTQHSTSQDPIGEILEAIIQLSAERMNA